MPDAAGFSGAEGVVVRLADALTVAPVIAIVRLPGRAGVGRAGIERAVWAVVDGGVPAAEITLTTPGALEALSAAQAALGDAACLGVGSVRTAADAARAVEAGARFLVTPTVAPDVLAAAALTGVPVFCGGLTPTELAAAHDAGAYAVKVFPAHVFGPGYLRDVLAPMPDLRLVPTGGVDPTNVADYARAGAVAVAAGSALVEPGLVVAGDWAAITARAAAFAAAWPS
jgi:2-dehydro-3-deoxyphosphogluconate aldolase/(4S)-4-hydroxy-2-oxoglutarate aldolase